MVKRVTKQKTVKEAFDSLKGQLHQEVSGVIRENGDVLTVEKHHPLTLTTEQQLEKSVLTKLLLKWLTPLSAGTKPDPERDLAMLKVKLEAQGPDDLWRFFDIGIPYEVQILMQSKYRDLSP
jgi:hypothetical protein